MLKEINDKFLAGLVEESGDLKEKISSDTKRLEMLIHNIKTIYVQSCEKEKSTPSPIITSTNYSATMQKRLTLEYFPEKLKEKVSKELYEEMVDKTYVLENAEEFFKELRKLKVPVKLVKKYIHSETTISKKKIQDLYDEGTISLSDLAGCYKANVTRVVKVEGKK